MGENLALKFLLDENVPNRIWRAFQRHNQEHEERLDVVRVGDLSDLPLSSDDPAILLWTEKHDRILITEDRSTMPVHLTRHLANGHTCPGILVLRTKVSATQVVEYLSLVAYASQAVEWQNRIEYIT